MKIKLPFPPSTNNLYLNVPGRGRVLSPEYRAWKVEAGHGLNRQKPGLFKSRAIIFISIDESRQGDCGNREKAVTDLLVEHGVLKGDQKRYVKRVSIGWESVEGCHVKLLGTE